MASEDDNPPGRSFEGDFQLNFDEQQLKISSLKELVRQTEINQGKNSAAQEKVKNIAQRLSQLKNKVSSKRLDSNDDYEPDISSIRHQSVPSTPIMTRARSETPGSEKIQLLRAQMEQNRQKMAEREGSKKGIEEMVIQLKAKFDSTQLSLEKSSKLGKSIGDLSQFSADLNRNRYKSQTDVSSISSNLDKEKIKLLEIKIKELEKQVLDKKMSTDDYKNKILDLEENLKEKECIIDARTQAVSLMSENLSMKGKNTIDLLEETKKEMIDMQNNFIKVENEMKDEINEKNGVIENLKQQNTILEDSRYNLTVDNSKLQELQESNQKNTEILLNTELELFLEENSITYENLVESLKKIIQTSNENFEKLSEKTIEYNVLNANFVVLEEKLKCLAPKSLFSLSSSDDDSEIMKLKQQMEDSNKSLIKTKLKIKQLEKEVDSFKKKSESLFNENQILQQKLTEEKSEKVSSNESIEIVEGLTNEEKLEMEESLKQTVSGIKSDEEELGLSDSLIKLREESSELMEKVELFTYERKEVLAKMESLTNENEILQGNYNKLEEEKNQLVQLLKDSSDKEIVSNFNKEIYVTALTNLENEMENFRKTKDKNNKLRLMKKVIQEGKIVHDLLNNLLTEHSLVLEQQSSESLNIKLKEEDPREDLNEELIKCKEEITSFTEKYSLKETEINELQEINKSLEKKQISTNEQINILNTLLAEQKQQLIEAFQTHELQVEDYENRLKSIDEEIRELKEIENKPDFSIELKNKQYTIDELNNQIIELYQTLEVSSNQVLEKDDEILYLKEVLDSNGNEIEKLNNQIKKNQEIISKFESQVNEISSSEEVSSLNQKNKEQLDKLKKFAANLKKKVVQCTDLESKLAEENEKNLALLNELSTAQLKLEEKSTECSEIKEYINKIENKLIDESNKCQQLQENLIKMEKLLSDEASKMEEIKLKNESSVELETDLKSKNIKIEKCKALIKEKNKEIQKLSENLTQFSSQLSIETIKLQENYLYIETIETENNHLKEKINKLEEGISYAEERRLSLSKKANLLDEELLNKSNEYEQNEDMLVQRLTALSERDDFIERKLNEKENENKDLKEILSTTTNQKDEFMKKVATLENQLEHIQSEQIENYEKENYLLSQEVQMLVKNSNKMQTDYEKRLQEKHSEIDELESELSSQIQQIEDEKKILQINNEKLNEAITKNVEEISRLKENVLTFEQLHSDFERELQGLRMQLVEEQTEFENLRSQNDSEISAQIQDFDNLKLLNEKSLEEIEILKEKLKSSEKLIYDLRNENSNLQSQNTYLSECEQELMRLRIQFSELESVKMQVGQNQTDDQVSIQNENERLKETIKKYQKELEEKKPLKNIESEIITEVPSFNSSIFFNSPGTSSLFDTTVAGNSQEVELKKQIQELTEEVKFLKSSRTSNLFEPPVVANKQEEEEKTSSFFDFSAVQSSQDSSVALNSQEIELKKKIQNLTEENNFLKSSGPSLLFETPLGTSSFFESPMVVNSQEVDMKKKIEELTEEINFLKSSSIVDNSLEVAMKQTIQELTEEVNFLKNSGTSLFFDSPAVQNSQEIEMKKKIEEMTEEVNSLKNSLISKKDEIDFVKETIAEPLMFGSEEDAFDPDPYAGLEPVVEDFVLSKSAYVCGTKVDSEPEQIITQLNQQIIKESNNYQNIIDNLNSSNKFFESRILELEDSLIKNQEEIGTREEIINKLKSSFMNSEMKIDELNDHLLRSQQIELHEIEKRENMIESLDNSNKQLENRILELEQFLNQNNEIITNLKNSCQQLETKLQESEKKPSGISSFFETEVSKDNIFDSFNPSAVEKDQVFELQNKNTELKDKILILEKEIQEKIVIEDSPWEIQETSEIALERDRLKDEIQSYQLKYAKILKKLKEYKQKIDKLESVPVPVPTTNNFNDDLDKAIQEELHSQVKLLEEKLNEMKNDAKNHLLEKEKLSKRIDVLTAGNDRMTNMKEKQDLDLQNYQMKVNQLNSKLQQLEDWDDSPSQDNSNSDELKQEINELKLANAKLEEQLTNTNDKQFISKIEELTHQISDLKISLTNLTDEYNGKLSEINILTVKQSELLNEIERMKTASLFQGPEFSVNPSTNQSINSDKRFEEISSELQYKESEILHLNQKIQDMQREDQTESLVQEILNKNFEINNLKKSIQEVTNDKTELENNLSLQLSQQMLPIKNEQVNVLSQTLLEKEEEINELKSENDNMLVELNALNEQVLNSLENEDKLKSVLLEIDMKNIEISELKSAINIMKSDSEPVDENVLPELSYDSSEIVQKMREALESQELEIVTLKEQLAIRSAELARLDPYGEKSLSSIDLKAFNGSLTVVDNSQSVPRSKLDLALYMLHQRDMRCEELTLELIGLLEERDSLQIKLSNSIRQIEEIKNDKSADVSPSSPAASINLQTKLSELQGVSHAKDKTLREQSDRRQFERNFMENDFSNIPEEAANKLIGANFNTMRESQSQSSVLFNWLLGKSNQGPNS